AMPLSFVSTCKRRAPKLSEPRQLPRLVQSAAVCSRACEAGGKGRLEPRYDHGELGLTSLMTCFLHLLAVYIRRLHRQTQATSLGQFLIRWDATDRVRLIQSQKRAYGARSGARNLRLARMRRTVATTRSNSIGLVSNSLHPAASAFSRSPASAWADSAMIGMSRVWGLPLSLREASQPSTTGISRSIRIISGRSLPAIAQPFSPSSAVSTSKSPSSSSRILSIKTLSSLSST